MMPRTRASFGARDAPAWSKKRIGTPSYAHSGSQSSFRSSTYSFAAATRQSSCFRFVVIILSLFALTLTFYVWSRVGRSSAVGLDANSTLLTRQSSPNPSFLLVEDEGTFFRRYTPGSSRLRSRMRDLESSGKLPPPPKTSSAGDAAASSAASSSSDAIIQGIIDSDNAFANAKDSSKGTRARRRRKEGGEVVGGEDAEEDEEEAEDPDLDNWDSVQDILAQQAKQRAKEAAEILSQRQQPIISTANNNNYDDAAPKSGTSSATTTTTTTTTITPTKPRSNSFFSGLQWLADLVTGEEDKAAAITTIAEGEGGGGDVTSLLAEDEFIATATSPNVPPPSAEIHATLNPNDNEGGKSHSSTTDYSSELLHSYTASSSSSATVSTNNPLLSLSRGSRAYLSLLNRANAFNETRLLNLLHHRPRRRADHQAVLKATHWVGEDRVLLVDENDDPDHGIHFKVPAEEWVDPLLKDKKRIKHELEAEIAVVIPTAPRILIPWQDDSGATSNYWIAKGDCKDVWVFDRIRREANMSTHFDWISVLSKKCDAEPRCVAFDTTGRLLEHYDQVVCMITAIHAQLPAPILGDRDSIYFKSPPTVAALPRRYDIQEWLVNENGESGPEVVPSVSIPAGQIAIPFTVPGVAEAAVLKKTEKQLTKEKKKKEKKKEGGKAEEEEVVLVVVEEEEGEGKDDEDDDDDSPSAPTTSWWVLNRAEVTARDLRRIDPTAGGKHLDEGSQKWYMRSVCLSDPRCMGFTFPSGWLKYSTDVTDIHASSRIATELWSRVPIPPMDYVTITAISLLRQVEAASKGSCNLGMTSPYDLLRDAGVDISLSPYNFTFDLGLLDGTQHPPPILQGIPPPPQSGDGNAPQTPTLTEILKAQPDPVEQQRLINDLTAHPFPRGIAKVVDADANGYRSMLGPSPNHPEIPTMRTHFYLVDTGGLELHANYLNNPLGSIPRSSRANDYWFRAFAWLRRRYGHSQCVSFVPATSYPRASETNLPRYNRGVPDFHPDNHGKSMPRQQTKQQLDFVSGLRFVAARSPLAHVLVWEDDCVACPATLEAYSRAAVTLSLSEPSWGCIKTGNGGSGLMFNADLVTHLITYLQTRRGSDNVDVSMWRFLHSGGWPDYIAWRTRSAHRGLTSSFRLAQGSVWGRVRCGGELDFHWGYYSHCRGDMIRDRLLQNIQHILGITTATATSSSSSLGEEAGNGIAQQQTQITNSKKTKKNNRKRNMSNNNKKEEDHVSAILKEESDEGEGEDEEIGEESGTSGDVAYGTLNIDANGEVAASTTHVVAKQVLQAIADGSTQVALSFIQEWQCSTHSEFVAKVITPAKPIPGPASIEAQTLLESAAARTGTVSFFRDPGYEKQQQQQQSNNNNNNNAPPANNVIPPPPTPAEIEAAAAYSKAVAEAKQLALAKHALTPDAPLPPHLLIAAAGGGGGAAILSVTQLQQQQKLLANAFAAGQQQLHHALPPPPPPAAAAFHLQSQASAFQEQPQAPSNGVHHDPRGGGPVVIPPELQLQSN